MRSSLSSVIFRQQYQPTELLRRVNVFTAIISVILLSSPSFSKYLRFLASNTIPEMPYALRHDLLSFSATSALCAAFKTLRWNARFQNRRYKNHNLLKIRWTKKCTTQSHFPVPTSLPHLPGRRYIHHFLPEGKINVFPFLQSGMLSKHEYAGTRLNHAVRLDFRRFMIFPETPISCQNGIKKWHFVSTYGCFSAVFHLSSLKTDKKEAL